MGPIAACLSGRLWPPASPRPDLFYMPYASAIHASRLRAHPHPFLTRPEPLSASIGDAIRLAPLSNCVVAYSIVSSDDRHRRCAHHARQRLRLWPSHTLPFRLTGTTVFAPVNLTSMCLSVTVGAQQGALFQLLDDQRPSTAMAATDIERFCAWVPVMSMQRLDALVVAAPDTLAAHMLDYALTEPESTSISTARVAHRLGMASHRIIQVQPTAPVALQPHRIDGTRSQRLESNLIIQRTGSCAAEGSNLSTAACHTALATRRVAARRRAPS
jgi:hypothetical protein